MAELGPSVKSVLGLPPLVVTAGGAADNVAQNGPAINRRGHYGAVLVVPIACALAASQNVQVTAKIQHRPEGGAFVDLPGATATVTLTNPTTNGLLELDVQLEGAEAEIRAVVTANLSAAGTDTATLGAVVVLGESQAAPI